MPVITASLLAELRARCEAPLMRCRWALKEAGGDLDKAVELLRQSGEIPAAPSYGTEFTRTLGTVPGFAEGYESAQRQQLFGKQLRELREARGLSQAQLAQLSSVDQGDISRFEAGKWGKRGISYEMLDRILPVLGMRLEHRVLPVETMLASDPRWQDAAVVMSGLL